jgi:hypothetical protein
MTIDRTGRGVGAGVGSGVAGPWEAAGLAELAAADGRGSFETRPQPDTTAARPIAARAATTIRWPAGGAELRRLGSGRLMARL